MAEPNASTDTVLYETKQIHINKDVDIYIDPEARLRIWDQIYLGNSPINESALINHVRDYGVLGDDTDETEGIQAAIAGTPDGGVLKFGSGMYKASNLVFDKTITLVGEGWKCLTNALFGNALYLDPERIAGTILKITATSGVGLLFSSEGVETIRPVIRHMAIIGPGTGTATGVQIGVDAAASSVSQAFLLDVLIANFKTGMNLESCYDGTFFVRFRGCDDALVLTSANQNVFVNTEVQFSTDTGIECTVNAAQNMFIGGVLQNISGTVGILLTGECNHVMGFYCEGITATDLIHLNATACSFSHSRTSSATAAIKVGNGARSVRLTGNRGSGLTPISIVGNANETVIDSSNRGFVVTHENERTAASVHVGHGGLVRYKNYAGAAPVMMGNVGEWWSPNCIKTTGAMVDGSIYSFPVYVPLALNIVEFGIEVTAFSATGTLVAGIYTDDGYLNPSALVADLGTKDPTTSNAVRTWTTDVDLEPGYIYHLAVVCVGGAPTVRIISTAHWTGRHLSMANALGASVQRHGKVKTLHALTTMPDPFGSSALSANIPLIGTKFG